MTGQLDQISQAIGGLQADTRNIGKQNEDILAEIRANQMANDARFQTNERDIQSLKQFRSRVYGVAGVVSFLGGVAGNLVGKFKG